MATFDQLKAPGECNADNCHLEPTYVVINGSLVGRVCTRHLTDLIEINVYESQLTYWDDALQVKPLREDEDD